MDVIYLWLILLYFKCLIMVEIGAHHAIARFVSNVTLIISHINYLLIRPTFEKLSVILHCNVYLTTFYGFYITWFEVYSTLRKYSLYLPIKKNLKSNGFILLNILQLLLEILEYPIWFLKVSNSIVKE